MRPQTDNIGHREFRVNRRYILTEYVHEALGQAVYDKLEDQTLPAESPAVPE